MVVAVIRAPEDINSSTAKDDFGASFVCSTRAKVAGDSYEISTSKVYMRTMIA
jgi:hypothetical protein